VTANSHRKKDTSDYCDVIWQGLTTCSVYYQPTILMVVLLLVLLPPVCHL